MRGWRALGIVLGVGGLWASDAGACECVGPRDLVWGPDRIDDAPLNTRIRFETSTGYRPRPLKSVLRAVGGADVEATERSWSDGELTFRELTPKSALLPGTHYEIAVVETGIYPSTTVLGTFGTGTTTDTTAPRLISVGSATAAGNSGRGGGSCSIPGPWIEIANVVADDPGRPDANLMFAIWSGDAAGSIDTSKPPAALVSRWKDGRVSVGKTSACDSHGMVLPTGPSAYLAIAAVDEAGNTSVIRKLPKVDLRGVGAHP